MAVVLGAATVLHAKEITVRGKLQKTVEAGGWLVVAGDTKYLILNSRDFTKHAWFKESTNVEAVGETKDVMTTFMEGTPFEAKSITPLEQGVATPGRDDGRRGTRVLVGGDRAVFDQVKDILATMAASVAGMCGMGVLMQAMVWLKLRRDGHDATWDQGGDVGVG